MILTDVLQQAQQAIEAGDYPRAEAIAREVLAESPECLTAHRVLAEACLELGTLEVAERHFQRALEIDPLCTVAMLGMGVVAEERGDKDAAHGWFFQAWELNPHLHQVRDELLRLRAEMGGEARLHPSRAGLAAIHARAGQWERASAEWQSVLELDPLSQLARTSLSTVLWRSGDDAGAAAAAEDALLLGARNAHALLVLAEVARRHHIDRPEYATRYAVVDPAGELADHWAAQMPAHDFSAFQQRSREVLVVPPVSPMAESVPDSIAGAGSDDEWIGLLGADDAVIAEAAQMREAASLESSRNPVMYEQTVDNLDIGDDTLLSLDLPASGAEPADQLAHEIALFGDVVVTESPIGVTAEVAEPVAERVDVLIREDHAPLADADAWLPDLEAEPVILEIDETVAEDLVWVEVEADAEHSLAALEDVEDDEAELVEAALPVHEAAVEVSSEFDAEAAEEKPEQTAEVAEVAVFAEESVEPVAEAVADVPLVAVVSGDAVVESAEDVEPRIAAALEVAEAEGGEFVSMEPAESKLVSADVDRDWPADPVGADSIGVGASGEAVQTAELVMIAEPELPVPTRAELLAAIDEAVARLAPARSSLAPLAADWYVTDNLAARVLLQREDPLRRSDVEQSATANWIAEGDFEAAEAELVVDEVVRQVPSTPELDRLLSSLDRARERLGADESIVAVEPFVADDEMLHVKRDEDLELVAVGAPMSEAQMAEVDSAVRAPERVSTDQLVGWRVQLFDDAASAGDVARELEVAIANGRQDPFAHRVLGEAYLHLGQVREAAGQFRQAFLHRTGRDGGAVE